MAARARRVILLGATGSIGRQAVEVLAHLNALHARGEHAVRHEVVGVAAGSRGGPLAELARALGCRDVALADRSGEISASDFPAGARVRRGPDAAERLVREVDADLVLAAMVGSSGLPATLAALELGRDVALANKETLVAAGALVVSAARRRGARLLPVDSEHAGVWQCLVPPGAIDAGARHTAHNPAAGGVAWGELAPPMALPPSVRRVVLTASGGPFRAWTRAQLEAATPEEALRHPTWSMGPKVTIDSASLMNKALELVEAHWLFGLEPARLGVLVHPQSVVHAIVESAGGSLIAQLGAPDMRGAIQHALAWPGVAPACGRWLDLAALSRLEFEAVDPERFPAVELALRVIAAGGTAGAVFNAANEVGVEAFLAGRLRFPGIVELAASALDAIPCESADTLDAVLRADARARAWARRRVDGE